MKKIRIAGDIISNDMAWIYDWLEWDYTCQRQIQNALEDANGDEVIFLINSGGGSVFDGYEIFNLIKDYPGKTTAKIVGLAASAASFIAEGADNVQACALSQMMIHRALNVNKGNAPSHHANASFLEGIDETIVKAYTMRSGKSKDEMIELMDKTTWITPEQALEIGIIDEIVNDSSTKPCIINSTDSEKFVLVNKLLELGSVENIKKALLENKGLGSTVVNSAFDNTKNKEETHMTLNELKEKEPALYNQIVEDAQKEAVTNERTRIIAINSLAKPGTEEQIKHGIENGLSAGDVAINILNAQTALNQVQLENMKKDAEESGVNNVGIATTPQNTSEQEKQSALLNMANFMNGGRK